ncbi:MAG: hypothetical protein J1F65_06380 [Clostridiales bacterium]|nr:hypothetical protein [Clostridiales bacterium]
MTKNKRIILIALLLVFCLVSTVVLSACMTSPRLLVSFDNTHTVYEGDSLDSLRPYLTVKQIGMFGEIAVVDGYTLSGTLTKGEATVTVEYEELSKAFTVTVVEKNADGGGGNGDDDGGGNGELGLTITLSLSKSFIEKNNYTDMTVTVSPSTDHEVQYRFIEGEDCVTRYGRSLRADKSGIVKVQAYIEDYNSNVASFQIVDPDNDPYKNVSSTSFYNNYNVATSLEDAYWRSEHNLMSGSITVPDAAPTVASNQPTSGNKFVRNSGTYYTDNGNTWEIVDASGNVVNRVYKFGAYVTLEEVAAYVYAFGDIPANYVASNSTGSLSGNAWGEYLRLNHNKYSNDNTGKYSYEPKLPETALGGKMTYYEIDIGTTGTNAGGYTPVMYNTGSKITRGAARIVYTRYFSNGDHVDDLEYRYVFYTYNHYNDFQEYLNYLNGWGEIFGNESNGGKYNSGSNPSPYVDVVRQNFQLLSAML